MSVKLGGYVSNRKNARPSKYSQRSCRLLPRARTRNFTQPGTSTEFYDIAKILAVLSFTTDLIGEKMEDGRLRFV